MSKRRLLIIDDEIEILEILSDSIDLLGLDLEVSTANNVDEAEVMLRECEYVLSDVNMPNKEKLERILKEANRPTARMTGNDDMTGELLIRKPFQKDNFEMVIKKLVS